MHLADTVNAQFTIFKTMHHPCTVYLETVSSCRNTKKIQFNKKSQMKLHVLHYKDTAKLQAQEQSWGVYLPMTRSTVR